MKPTPKIIYQETAIDLLVDALFQYQDTDETLKKLGIHRKDLRVLESDDEIYSAIETRREALIATPWRLENCTSKNNKFIESELKKHIVSLLRGTFDAVLYGYSVQEVIYRKCEDGKIGLQQVSTKPFEWFEPKSNGDLIYRSMTDPLGSAVDQVFKFLLTIRNETYRQPYGEAILSRLYWAWLFRVNGWKFWAKNLERTAIPFLKGNAKDGVTIDGTPNHEYLGNLLNVAVQNSSIALPEGWEAEFMSVQQNGATFEQFEGAILKRIQKIILGQTLTSDVGKTGSFAAAKVHADVLDNRRKADIRLAITTVQKLVDALHTLNGFTGQPPTFVLADDTGLENERADRDSKLVQAGIVKLTPDYLLRVYDYEDGDFEVPTEPILKNSTTPEVTKPNKKADFSTFSASNEPIKFTPEQMVIENVADDLLENLSSPFSNEQLQNVIKSAKSPEDLEQRLAVLMANADFSQFQQVLEKSLFVADVIGYAHA